MLGQLESDDTLVIADMEAGIGTLTRIPERSLDRVLLVTNPSVKALEVARLARQILTDRGVTSTITLVANRVRGSEDVDQIRAAFPDLDLVTVPEDGAIQRADLEGLSPLDTEPHAPAVRAIVDLARTRIVR